MHIVEGVEFEPLRFELLQGEQKALAHPKRCAAIDLPAQGLRSDMQHMAQIASHGLWSEEYMQVWESAFPVGANGFHAMDLCQAAPLSLRRYGTLALLNHMARRAKILFDHRRQKAINAGRWWPVPSQVVVGYGDHLRISLHFQVMQQPLVLHWIWKSGVVEASVLLRMGQSQHPQTL